MSTGVYGYPLEEAGRIAVEESCAALTQYPELERVILVAFSDEARAIYEDLVQEVYS